MQSKLPPGNREGESFVRDAACENERQPLKVCSNRRTCETADQIHEHPLRFEFSSLEISKWRLNLVGIKGNICHDTYIFYFELWFLLSISAE